MRFLSQKFKTNLFIKYFGFTIVPLIFYCKPKVVAISTSQGSAVLLKCLENPEFCRRIKMERDDS